MFNQKKYGTMKNYRIDCKEQWAGIYSHYDEWKDNDRFYFIPLEMRLLYARPPGGIFMVPDPVFLGTFVRNNIEFSDFFSASCPGCGHRLYPYHIDGCPASERVDLQLSCCDCGWEGMVRVGGWHMRSEMLKLTQAKDRLRLERLLLTKPGFKAADLKGFMEYCVLIAVDRIERSENCVFLHGC